VEEAVLPENLQRIEPEDVIKVKELGRGQFGSVWLGRWLGIQVAMKELHSSDGRSRQDLMGEAEMLASLRHPCVVAFYGVVAAEPLLPPLTVTEFMCDGSLRGALIRLRQDKHFMVAHLSSPTPH
jgi:serine/threonine protein kinase